jgi:hypothetical protein
LAWGCDPPAETTGNGVAAPPDLCKARTPPTGIGPTKGDVSLFWLQPD